jgi:shikimate dehydrogenase
VVQFGAGGAGSAVAYALMTLGVENLTVVDVDCSRAEAVAAGLRARFGANRVKAGTEDAVATADGVVNTTPLGMDKYPGMPLLADHLRADLWVSEIVYFPIETALLRAARAAGCRTLDGGGMAVFQAVKAFELFTGTTPDDQRMLRHFAALGGATA